MTDLRSQVMTSIYGYSGVLKPLNKNLKVLEVGIAGDPRPGGNYKLFGVGNDYQTLDVNASYKPDIIADICDTHLPKGSFDIILYSQTMEHVFDYLKSIRECFRLLRNGGYLIIDIPFMYPYHAEEDFGDYWRMSPDAMSKLLNSEGFEILSCELFAGILTSALARKPEYA